MEPTYVGCYEEIGLPLQGVTIYGFIPRAMPSATMEQAFSLARIGEEFFAGIRRESE